MNDQELHGHIIDIKSMLSGQDAKLTAVKENLDHHIAADDRKFKDLYERHDDHEKFKARVKGTARGVTAGIGIVGMLSAAVAKAKGWF
jgi:hypothetical protein